VPSSTTSGLRVAGRRKLNECVIGCGLPHLGRGDPRIVAARANRNAGKGGGPAPVRRGLARFRVRRGGPASTAYWGTQTCSHGTSPPEQIILREAGGIVSGIAGDDDPLKTGKRDLRQ